MVTTTTKAIVFVMLNAFSVIWSLLKNRQQTNLPNFWPESIGNFDQTFGFLISYFVLPLLLIVEDRKDYSRSQSASPEDSSQNYQLFARFSLVLRYLVGLVVCLHVVASEKNELQLDPFQVMLASVFTVSSVSSKMVAYLHKFTESHFLSLVLPFVLSLSLLLAADAGLGPVNSVANYVAAFFAYQFLIIIPFGLLYLRSC